MRKYVVPIVALVGIALLSPRSDAANLIIKSRLGVPGHPVSLPVSVTQVGGTTQLWGLDFALNFDTAKLGVGTDPGGNGTAFSPQAVTGSTEVPVVVSGTTFVGTGATNPNLYVGIVRGTSAFTTTSSGTANIPTSAIGLLRLSVAGSLVQADYGTVVNLAVPPTYNVANDGTGSTTVSRPGATGATSDATAGSAVNSEAITVLDNSPVPGVSTISVPLHKVAISFAPGDVFVSAQNRIDSGDLSLVARATANKVVLTDYQKIAADVAPANGYVPGTNYGGTAGLSYGDGAINSGDLSAFAKKTANVAGTIFPVAE